MANAHANTNGVDGVVGIPEMLDVAEYELRLSMEHYQTIQDSTTHSNEEKMKVLMTIAELATEVAGLSALFNELTG